MTLLLVIPKEGLTQSTWKIVYDENIDPSISNKRFPTKQDAVQYILGAYGSLLTQGYFDAKLDTTTIDSVIHVDISKGEPYFLRTFELQQDSFRVNSFTEKWKKPKPFESNLLDKKTENVLREFENRGYPFVSIKATSLKIEGQTADATFQLESGPLILMDSLVFRNESKIPKRYVKNYLDIRKGDLYDEEKIQNTQKRLREIPFITIRQSPEIRFKPGKADLYLFLEKKKANYFNGILGLRPDDVTGKVNITGDAEIKLLNAFNGGEEIYLNWRKMQALTQDLTSKLLLPYLFNTPIGVEGQLKIYKRDSTFTSVKSSAGMVFNFGGMNRIKLFVEKNSSNQIAQYITAQALANVNATFYGLGLVYEELDYRYNPRKGYSIQAEGATGFRQVRNNNQNITGENDAAIRYTVHRFATEFDGYIPTWKKQCVHIAAKSAALITPSIYENEMNRIGGLRTMRGVDEETINTTSYIIGTIEYRLLYEENSALYLFLDQGWYEKKSATSFLTDTPIGFGAGVNFETKAGIFTFNYALGQQFDNPVLVRNAKVSFGFRNVF
jgi:outer membrane protein assembly factor BamA